MLDELWDEQAFICTDCLMLIANGDGPNYEYDYPGKSEDEYAAMRADYDARIDRTMAGYRITCGWGREQHDCASNVTVTPIYRRTQDNGVTVTTQSEEDAKEYRFDTVSEAIEAAEFDFPDAAGFHGIAHDLETEGDRGGECYCEEDSFSERDCDHCGDHFAGTWHAATIWKITEDAS
jgi:hypothetical protein